MMCKKKIEIICWVFTFEMRTEIKEAAFLCRNLKKYILLFIRHPFYWNRIVSWLEREKKTTKKKTHERKLFNCIGIGKCENCYTSTCRSRDMHFGKMRSGLVNHFRNLSQNSNQITWNFFNDSIRKLEKREFLSADKSEKITTGNRKNNHPKNIARSFTFCWMLGLRDESS